MRRGGRRRKGTEKEKGERENGEGVKGKWREDSEERRGWRKAE